MKVLLVNICIMIVLSSCIDTTDNEDLNVGLYADIGMTAVSKTITDSSGEVLFENNDMLGVFVSDKDNPFLWKYENGSWMSCDGMEWTNRSDRFDFYAFYPFNGDYDISKDNIPMPDLSVQTGNINDVGKIDFLSSRCTSSYNDNDGYICFTGNNSLKHVYSLIHINIVCEDSEGLEISGCKFSGRGIVSRHYYSFGKNSEPAESMHMIGNEISELKIDGCPSFDRHNIEYVVLLNPGVLDNPLNFTLYYTKGNDDGTVSIDLIRELSVGSYQKITINWGNGGFLLTGNVVKDWNEMILDDIYFE